MKKHFMLVSVFIALVLLLSIRYEETYPPFQKETLEETSKKNIDMEILYEGLLPLKDSDYKNRGQVVISTIEEWGDYRDVFYNLYHINLDQIIDESGKIIPAEIDFEKYRIFINLRMASGDVVERQGKLRPTIALEENDNSYKPFKLLSQNKENVVTVIQEGQRHEVVNGREELLRHYQLSIFKVPKKETIQSSIAYEPLSDFNKGYNKIERYKNLYQGFVSLTGIEGKDFPDDNETLVFDTLEEWKAFDQKYSMNLISYKYFNIGQPPFEVAPRDLDFSKYSILLDIHSDVDNAKSVGWKSNNLYYRQGDYFFTYDYNNPLNILNDMNYDTGFYTKHVYITLLKIEKRIINKNSMKADEDIDREQEIISFDKKNIASGIAYIKKREELLPSEPMIIDSYDRFLDLQDKYRFIIYENDDKDSKLYLNRADKIHKWLNAFDFENNQLIFCRTPYYLENSSQKIVESACTSLKLEEPLIVDKLFKRGGQVSMKPNYLRMYNNGTSNEKGKIELDHASYFIVFNLIPMSK